MEQNNPFFPFLPSEESRRFLWQQCFHKSLKRSIEAISARVDKPAALFSPFKQFGSLHPYWPIRALVVLTRLPIGGSVDAPGWLSRCGMPFPFCHHRKKKYRNHLLGLLYWTWAAARKGVMLTSCSPGNTHKNWTIWEPSWEVAQLLCPLQSFKLFQPIPCSVPFRH